MGQSAKISLLSVSFLAITGCAQLSAVGDFAWTATEDTANFFYKPVASLLRPSPQQTYVFDESQGYDVVMYNQPVAAPSQAKKRVIAAQDYNLDTSEQSFESQSTQSVQITGTGYYQSEPVPAIPDISFAKVGGGSNMQDWLACEEKAGGYLYWEDGKGYALDPTFESCMRGKDYALESEIAQGNSAL